MTLAKYLKMMVYGMGTRDYMAHGETATHDYSNGPGHGRSSWTSHLYWFSLTPAGNVRTWYRRDVHKKSRLPLFSSH